MTSCSDTLSNLMGQPHVDRWEEAAIIACLADAADDELNDLLGRINVHRLLAVVDRHFAGPDNYRDLLDLLARERLEALDVTARARLLDALQVQADAAGSVDAMRRILLATKGLELTQLKNRVDTAGHHRDLQRLVYRLLPADMREDVLQHIRQQGAQLPPQGRKSISDIDDTLFASLHDERYPKGTVYPGVLQYHEALLGGAVERALVLITARPKVLRGLLEDFTHRRLRSLGIAHRTTVLSGSFQSLTSRSRMAAMKLENFLEFAQLFPEYRFVFTGDSGQGDAEFAAALLAEHSECVEAALIHDVVDTPPAQRRHWASRGVAFFDTYVGAGAIACQRGLLGRSALKRLGEASRKALPAIRFSSADKARKMQRLLQRDLAQTLPLSTASVCSSSSVG